MRLPGSFRDPAGHVFVADGTLFRRIERAGRVSYDRLIGSGLYQALVAEGLLLPHEEIAREERDGAIVIRPERIPLISYPYEWCFSQLRDAALLTLRLQRTAMRFGMSLKDASAYNVQFMRGRPVFIDTLSFEESGGGPWVAYRQFCQHFYAPLLLWSSSDPQLGRLQQVFIDGVPLPFASRLLPGSSWLRVGPLMHVHLHAKAEAKFADRRLRGGAASASQGSRRGVEALVESLERAVASTHWSARSDWSSYYAEQPSYGPEAFDAKVRLVGEWIARARPATVWDVGANTGRFSRIAAEHGARVTAFDADPACVEIMYRQSKAEQQEALLPLVSDLTNPSPAIGWANEERLTLEQRGPADLVLALALVHHLAIGNNVPLPAIAAYFARLGRRLIVEFVPKNDAMVQRMLAGRRDIFDTYARQPFEEAFSSHFRIDERAALAASDRHLYLMTARG